MIPVGNARFGAGNLSLIAGPCAVEDEERLEEIARGVLRTGAWLLRAGAFKPRTSPYSFQGIGVEGLDILDRVKASTGIGVVTEVLDPRDVERVNETADMIQVGARNMANFPLLVELGQLSTPVLLKRGFGATVEELLGAAEYILAEGNRSVILCERGVRGFDSITRHILDVGAVAYLKKTTHLPVIVDPSHAAGRADLVRPLARAGIAAGADGLLVEVHPHPEEVHSDGAQAVSLSSFERIVEDVTTLAALDGRRLVRSGLPPSSMMHQDSNSPLDRPS
jgi:3-deoxy-7-phosphoheptulonate synthase